MIANAGGLAFFSLGGEVVIFGKIGFTVAATL